MFAREGANAYLGEAVTQLEHALQAAHLAARDNEAPPLVAAALLHDVGHLLGHEREDTPLIDFQHEERARLWLCQHFPEDVWAPVMLHVAAKRYLCTVEPDYYGKLSDDSIRSLALQGELMSPEEVAAFRANPWHAEAVRLRRHQLAKMLFAAADTFGRDDRRVVGGLRDQAEDDVAHGDAIAFPQRLHLARRQVQIVAAIVGLQEAGARRRNEL